METFIYAMSIWMVDKLWRFCCKNLIYELLTFTHVITWYSCVSTGPKMVLKLSHVNCMMVTSNHLYVKFRVVFLHISHEILMHWWWFMHLSNEISWAVKDKVFGCLMMEQMINSLWALKKLSCFWKGSKCSMKVLIQLAYVHAYTFCDPCGQRC